MFIVNGIYGGCTDIVTGVIDSSDVDLYTEGMYISFSQDREILNGSVNPHSKVDFFEMAKSLEPSFKSIQSNLQKRHIEPRTLKRKKEFNYIYVDPSSEKIQAWINHRLKVLHTEYSSPDIQAIQNEKIILTYTCDIVITVEEILEGKLIEKLEPHVDSPLDSRLYEAWLMLLKNDFPY